MPETTDFPACPYCGSIDDDNPERNITYWGSQDGPLERECGNCEKSFIYEEIVRRSWHDICKTISVNSDVARDIQRGFAHLINKLRTKAAGAPEIDEAIDKKPVAQMLEVAK
jgi:hypothetical protein